MAETVRVMISEEETEQRIRELGEKISEDYKGKQVQDRKSTRLNSSHA